MLDFESSEIEFVDSRGNVRPCLDATVWFPFFLNRRLVLLAPKKLIWIGYEIY